MQGRQSEQKAEIQVEGNTKVLKNAISPQWPEYMIHGPNTFIKNEENVLSCQLKGQRNLAQEQPMKRPLTIINKNRKFGVSKDAPELFLNGHVQKHGGTKHVIQTSEEIMQMKRDYLQNKGIYERGRVYKPQEFNKLLNSGMTPFNQNKIMLHFNKFAMNQMIEQAGHNERKQSLFRINNQPKQLLLETSVSRAKSLGAGLKASKSQMHRSEQDKGIKNLLKNNPSLRGMDRQVLEYYWNVNVQRNHHSSAIQNAIIQEKIEQQYQTNYSEKEQISQFEELNPESEDEIESAQFQKNSVISDLKISTAASPMKIVTPNVSFLQRQTGNYNSQSTIFQSFNYNTQPDSLKANTQRVTVPSPGKLNSNVPNTTNITTMQTSKSLFRQNTQTSDSRNQLNNQISFQSQVLDEINKLTEMKDFYKSISQSPNVEMMMQEVFDRKKQLTSVNNQRNLQKSYVNASQTNTKSLPIRQYQQEAQRSVIAKEEVPQKSVIVKEQCLQRNIITKGEIEVRSTPTMEDKRWSNIKEISSSGENFQSQEIKLMKVKACARPQSSLIQNKNRAMSAKPKHVEFQIRSDCKASIEDKQNEQTDIDFSKEPYLTLSDKVQKISLGMSKSKTTVK